MTRTPGLAEWPTEVSRTDLRARLKRALGDWAAAWHPELSFDAAERRLLEERLYRLMTLVAGEPVDEENLTDFEGVSAWAIQAASDGLDRHLRGLAGNLGPAAEAPVYWREEGEDPPVTLGHWESRLDLSGASVQELSRLPSIGPALAERIAAFREEGRLREVEDLLQVPGLGKAKLTAIRPLVYVSRPEAHRGLSTPALDAFRYRPTMGTYVEVILWSGGSFTTAPGGTRTGPAQEAVSANAPARLATLVLDEVARAADAAAAQPPPEGGGLPVGAEEAARVGRLILRGRALAASGAARSEAAWTGLVDGSAYLPLALKLIESAKSEINVVMFFMTYDPDDQAHPSNVLVESLVVARRRGVRVTVTLDLDRPGDVFGSRLVNQAAYQYLAAAGAEVAWDRQEKLTHAKLLVVDGRDILAGSHNWTAGSLYAYDDKSLVARSPALAEALKEAVVGR